MNGSPDRRGVVDVGGEVCGSRMMSFAMSRSF
jgi:hypothetical protein